MSSTTITCLLAMSRSRSLRMRTTPEEVRPGPYEETAMNSSSTGRACAAQRPGEVGHEDERALEHADQQHAVVLGVVGRDLLGQLVDLALDLLLGHHDALDVGVVPGTLRPLLLTHVLSLPHRVIDIRADPPATTPGRPASVGGRAAVGAGLGARHVDRPGRRQMICPLPTMRRSGTTSASCPRRRSPASTSGPNSGSTSTRRPASQYQRGRPAPPAGRGVGRRSPATTCTWPWGCMCPPITPNGPTGSPPRVRNPGMIVWNGPLAPARPTLGWPGSRREAGPAVLQRRSRTRAAPRTTRSPCSWTG